MEMIAICVACCESGPANDRMCRTFGNTCKISAIPTSKARFSQAAIDAVRQWRFEPFQFDGKPVDVQQTIDVVFSLTK